jgi:methyltransferase (TIGR00027 family)
MMRTHEASKTADTTTICRALESRKPEHTRLCYDPYAAHFSEPEFSKRTQTRLSTFLYLRVLEWLLPGFSTYFAIRTRYIDEYLQSCLEQSCKQVVILGAGYDSRAYRIPELKGQIRVFEVDHPATQQEKLTKLTSLFETVPDHVVYVPLDFHRQSLAQRLKEHGYDESLMTAFVWEGVTYYLTEDAVNDTLAYIVTHSAPHSSIVFDYTSAEVVTGDSPLKEVKTWRTFAEKKGEQLRFGIHDDKIDAFLTQKGFAQVTHVTSDILKRRYLTGVNKKRRLTSIFTIATATVKAR